MIAHEIGKARVTEDKATVGYGIIFTDNLVKEEGVITMSIYTYSVTPEVKSSLEQGLSRVSNNIALRVSFENNLFFDIRNALSWKGNSTCEKLLVVQSQITSTPFIFKGSSSMAADLLLKLAVKEFRDHTVQIRGIYPYDIKTNQPV